MKESDIHDMKSMIAEADRLGAEVADIEDRNKRRRAKGKKPLPDPSAKKDQEVLKIKYRTGQCATIDGSQALAVYERRKAEMLGRNDDDDDDEEEEKLAAPPTTPTPGREPAKPMPAPEKPSPKERGRRLTGEAEKILQAQAQAQAQAEEARRAQDLKNGRIDHAGNWSPEGQQLDGGDETSMPSNPAQAAKVKSAPDPEADATPVPHPGKTRPADASSLEDFKRDLYGRLKISFEGLERTLSELQGSVAAIVTASASSIVPKAEDEESMDDAFKALISRKTPVTFNVGGTRMTFDAVCVFHAAPCITVVSKADSATIVPKPGAQLLLTYEMDGQRYADDPVTFLGTRFELPMFGLSFVGFIRDRESDMMDVEYGPEGDNVGGGAAGGELA